MIGSLSLTAKIKIGLLLAALALAAALPYLVSPFVVSIAALALIYGLFSMSIDLLGGYGGLIALGQAGILATAGYGVGYTAVHLGGSHLQQVFIGISAGLVASIIFGAMAMRTTGIYFIMVTLAQGMIVWGLSIRLAPVTGAENGLRGILRPQIVSADWKFYYAVAIIVLICGGLLLIVTKSPFGLFLRGLRDSEMRLRMLGYNSTFQKFYAFVVSGFFASIAGVLLVYHTQFISPANAEFLVSGNGVLMAILGGIGTLIGPVIGAFIIVFAENMLSSYVERWPTVLGITFILVILFARDGFVGTISNYWHGLRRKINHTDRRRGPSRPQIYATETASDNLEEPNPGLDQEGQHSKQGDY